ncbi:tryptophan halogenase family protein [Thalassococcus sp. BH17M4-6]|uniref:tryptophan halogenase family protein n=1 Tax=Thalassococcus sp. BH17M4-6 TaxID=3413148 RepID=UPI003BE83B82
MGQPIKSVTIVGGGTAGWMAATLMRTLCKPDLRITLIESPTIATVGVGEATVPNMPVTLRHMQIRDREFFRTCNATFKLGVMFRHWNVDRKGRFIDYINGFNPAPAVEGSDIGYHYHAFGGGKRDFAQCFAPSIDLVRQNKAPISLGQDKAGQGHVGYAYHLDAVKFAGLLADVGVKRGVTHLRDDVDDVELDDRGYVAALKLRETGRHPVELVIDCTGFRALIINKALGEPFESYSDYLGNDRAMALQIPHPDPMKIASATSSTALGAGWSWRVPLFNRIGTGYVFSSAHRTDDQARDEFLAHLGSDAPKGAEPRIIPMRIGRSRRAWVKNCVALGLSSGFIEPLESTAIHMVDMGIRWLMTHFPDSDFADAPRNRYNQISNAMFNEVRDFISLHYRLGNRTDDPYWIDARTELKISDLLAENLELWKRQLPGPLDLPSQQLFSHRVYQAVLLGKQVYQTGYGADFNWPFQLRRESWLKFLDQSAKFNAMALRHKADHRTALLAIRGELEPSKPKAPSFPVAAGTVPLPGATVKASFKVREEVLDGSAPGLF